MISGMPAVDAMRLLGEELPKQKGRLHELDRRRVKTGVGY